MEDKILYCLAAATLWHTNATKGNARKLGIPGKQTTDNFHLVIQAPLNRLH